MSAIDFHLKELELCHAEIARRSSEQFRTVVAALLSIGTVIGLVSEFTDSLVNLLAAVPWVHAVLGYVWVDHAFAIFRCGEYIRRVLEPDIRRQIENDKVGHLKYVGEARIAAAKAGNKPSAISHYFPAIFFILPSLLAMFAFAFNHGENKTLPEPFAIMLFSASLIFVFSLYRHWRFTTKYIQRVTSEPLPEE